MVLSRLFERLADILEFKGENPFKINAYRKAARIISNLSDDIEMIYRTGKLQEVPGIGEGIAKKIAEYIQTGRISKYEKEAEDVPDTLIELMAIPSVGPKTLAVLHRELKVNNLDDLKRVLDEGKVAKLPRLGEKRAENIKKGIEYFQKSKGRVLLGEVLPLVERIVKDLEDYCTAIAPAGSVRRMRETIGDIDILCSAKNTTSVINKFLALDMVKEVLAAGETKASIITEDMFQVDLRVVAEESFGAALQYFTGSKAHNIRLRELAKQKNMKISEYGIFDADSRKLGGRTEEEIYELLGMLWIAPELREDNGEVEASIFGRLPRLVEYGDILGDFHIHSNYSDGTASIEQIVEYAKQLNYKFIVICDHSQSVKYAGGLSPDKLLYQIEHIRNLNDKISQLEILCGNEVDIKPDGTLDYPESILKELDVVVAAVHMGFKQRVTERLIAACENPYVNIIAHPTGRLIGEREGYEVDIDKVFDAAARTNTALEVNAYYERLDLNDLLCSKAKKFGIKLAIGTDAHHVDQLWMLKLGVGVVRRAWIEPKDLLNTYSPSKLKDYLKTHKKHESCYKVCQ